MAAAILMSPVPGLMNSVADVCGYSNATRSGFGNNRKSIYQSAIIKLVFCKLSPALFYKSRRDDITIEKHNMETNTNPERVTLADIAN